MSELRDNHLALDGGPAKDEEHIASYKPIPENDTVNEITYVDANSEFVQIHGIDMDTNTADEEDGLWNRESVNKLLDLYLQKIHKFRDPKIKKRKLWTEIGSYVGKSPDACNRKFRNLKSSYLRVLSKKMSGKETRWPYLKAFQEIYHQKSEYYPEIQEKKLRNKFNSGFAPSNRIRKGSSQSEEYPSATTNNLNNTDKNCEFRILATEMKERQQCVEHKLDRLIKIVEESNEIQRERNQLFQEYLKRIDK